MKQFQSRLDELYEGLHLKKTYIPETEKPDFKNENSFKLNFILHKVYSMVDFKVKQGRNEDVPDKEKLADYEKFFKDILYTIDSMYADKPRAPFTPEGTVEEDDLDITSWAPDKPFKGQGDIWTGDIKEPEVGGEGTFRLEIDRVTGELIGEYQIDGSKWYKFDGIEFKNLSTGEPTTSNTRIQRQLSRAIRFNPDFQEEGTPKYDVTSPATNDSGGPMTHVGKWDVSILWNQEEKKPLEAGESWNFVLRPESIKR